LDVYEAGSSEKKESRPASNNIEAERIQRRHDKMRHRKEARDLTMSRLRGIPDNLSDEEEEEEQVTAKNSSEQDDSNYLTELDGPRIPNNVSRNLRRKANKLADQMVNCLSLR